MTNPVRRLWGLRRRLYAILGAPGLMIVAISLLSFGFGLIVLAREYNRPRKTGLEALHQVISGWVSLPDPLGRTLVDYVDLWRHADPDRKAGQLEVVHDAVFDLGYQLDQQSERFPLIWVVALELGPDDAPPLVRWVSPLGGGALPSAVVVRVPLFPEGREPAISLRVRYRVVPTVERAAAGLEASYRRLLLALLGFSGYSLLCLGYMILSAQALSERSAREAAREATLDLADRTCHELGNGVFVLSNERRNLTDLLDLIDRFVAQEPEARAAAVRRLGVDPELAARWDHALKREYASRGIDPDLELRNGAAVARDVCRQISVCAEYITLTVRELDGFLKRSALPVTVEPVVVCECFDEALALLGPRLEAADARVEWQSGLLRGLTVRGDRRLLVHALVNLLKNAVEAASIAGNVPEITLSARVEGATAWIGVADNGPGIPAADVRHIFDDGYSTKGAGRGRGLAIVRESIHIQGGILRHGSRPGGGTLFQIGLPLAAEAEALHGTREQRIASA